jgi:hypothetical protein
VKAGHSGAVAVALRAAVAVALRAAVAALCAAASGCHRGAAASTVGAATEDPPPATVADEPMSPAEEQAWARAEDGGEAESVRLVDLVGCTTLRERAKVPERRAAAIRAMSGCDDFSELPWLASLAADGRDDEALAALDAIVDQAARPRRPADPEDAEELASGCQTLLALSRATSEPRPRRVLAVRSLRMLAERGCVKKSDIPTDLDAKE